MSGSVNIIYNFKTYCRTCLTRRKMDELVPIFQDCFLETDLRELTNVELAPNPSFPNSMCYECLNFLRISTTFISRVKNAEVQLNNLLETVQMLSGESKGRVLEVIETKNPQNNPSTDVPSHETTLEIVQTGSVRVRKKKVIRQPSAGLEENTDMGVVKVKKVRVKKEKPIKIKKEVDNTPCVCDQCGRAFKRRNHLALHLRNRRCNVNVKGEDVISTCDQCGKTFRLRSNLRLHLKRVHMNERPFRCSICDMTFKYKKGLVVHELRHAGNRPYQCHICPKAFYSKKDLDKHIETHSSQPKYLCDVCPKAFKTYANLYQHKQTHSKPNCQCDICGFTTSWQYMLKCHMKKHQPGETISCDVCQMGFTSVKEMRKHKKQHYPLDFTCHICNKTFDRQPYLKKHMSLHSNFLRYQCDFCGKRFRCQGNFSTHRKKHTELGLLLEKTEQSY